MARYWNYWDETSTATSTTTGGQYYSTWTTTGSTSATTFYTSAYVIQSYVVERYVITGFEGWSDEARAVLTRLINDETNTGFKVTLWARDIEITDPSIMIRDLDWFLMCLRARATFADYKKIADHIAQVRAELASGTLPRENAKRSRPKASGPTRSKAKGDAK